MTQQSSGNSAASAFAEHVRAFHRSLPNEEKQLLEQIFALAEAATTAMSAGGDETQGYALGTFYDQLTGGGYLADKFAPMLPLVFSQLHAPLTFGWFAEKL